MNQNPKNLRKIFRNCFCTRKIISCVKMATFADNNNNRHNLQWWLKLPGKNLNLNENWNIIVTTTFISLKHRILVVQVVSDKNVKPWEEKTTYWLVTKNVSFEVNPGSFGHNCLRWFASLHNDKIMLLYLNFLLLSSHY